MSVGHVARLLEEAGIATVIIAADPFRPRLEVLALPRLLLTPHPMGRVLGAPGDVARQTEVLRTALRLLDEAEQGQTIVTMPGHYRLPPHYE